MAYKNTNIDSWRLVRWMPPNPKTNPHQTGGASTIAGALPYGHPSRDQVGWYGNDIYGVSDDYDDPWSIHFGKHDQLLFATANLKYWGILEIPPD